MNQREMGTEEGYLGSETPASLPVLCIEDGSVILRFCEFFGAEVVGKVIPEQMLERSGEWKLGFVN